RRTDRLADRAEGLRGAADADDGSVVVGRRLDGLKCLELLLIGLDGLRGHGLGALVGVAARSAASAELVHRRRLVVAALLGQAAALREDAPGDRRAGGGQRARDRG